MQTIHFYKGKTLCYVFISIALYNIVRLLYVLICIINVSFLRKGINIATLYKGSLLDFNFLFYKNCLTVELPLPNCIISDTVLCINCILMLFNISILNFGLHFWVLAKLNHC